MALRRMNELPEITFVHGAATVASPSIELLETLLKTYDDELRRGGVDVDTALRPGLPREDIVRALHAAGLSAPEELICWFAWHNGGRHGQQFPNLAPASLESAIGVQRMIARTPIDRGMDPDGFWGHAGLGWLRLGIDSDDVAVYCGADASDIVDLRQPGYDDDQSGRCRAVSLCTWVAWRIIGIRNGAYGRYDASRGGWDFHPELVDSTQRRAGFR